MTFEQALAFIDVLTCEDTKRRAPQVSAALGMALGLGGVPTANEIRVACMAGTSAPPPIRNEIRAFMEYLRGVADAINGELVGIEMQEKSQRDELTAFVERANRGEVESHELQMFLRRLPKGATDA